MLADGFYFYDGTTYRKFVGILQEFKEHTQSPINADEMTVQIDAGTPAPPFGEVIFVVEGVHKFHGIITKIDEITNKISCKSMQWLLSYRVIPDNTYHNVDLNTIFSSDPPVTVMGVWLLINGYIPNGKWIMHSATVAKLLGGGLRSCFGNRDLYASSNYANVVLSDGGDGLVKLTEVTSIPAAANTFYRTPNDLYVRFGDGTYGQNATIITALNWCDTRIRRGVLDLGARLGSIEFSMMGQASTSINDFANKLGKEIEFVPKQDGTLAFNMATELPGRSSTTNPIKSYRDWEDGARVLITNQDVPDVQAAISFSSDVCEAPQVVSDWDTRGVQLIKPFSNNGYPKEDVLKFLQDIIDNNTQSRTVTTNQVDYFLRVGDWVGAWSEKGGQVVLRVKEKVIRNGIMTLTLGKRITTPSAIFGSYLRGEIQDSEEPLKITSIGVASGSTVSVAVADPAAFADGAVKVYYEESFSAATDATLAAGYCWLTVNGIVVAPGRIRFTGSVKVDITDYCSGSASNVIYRYFAGTGWSAREGYIKQYRCLKFIE